MPAKRKLLPQPCPICGITNGTVQLAIFGDDIICRIGHYSPKRYKTAVDKSKQYSSQLPTDYNSKKDIQNAQRVWCSFRSRTVNWGLRKIKMDEHNNDKIKSIKLPINVFLMIQNNGWQILPNHSTRYRGRTHKSIEFLK